MTATKGLDLKGLVLAFSYVAIGLSAYMAVHNLKLQLRLHWPRRWFYALAYGCVAVLLWEIATFAVYPAVHIPGDTKSAVFLLSLVGFTVGMVGIFWDHHKRRKAGQTPPAG